MTNIALGHFDNIGDFDVSQYQVLRHFDGSGHYEILTIANTLTYQTFGRFYNTGNFDIAMILYMLMIQDTMDRQLLFFIFHFV